MKVKVLVVAALVILVALTGGNRATSTSIAPLKEINYYPRDYAWLQFWPNWPLAKIQMDADLDEIQGLGFNTVRIFLHPSVFGYPQPTATYLGYFEEALALIAAHGLEAHVNLFDCWWSWNDVAGSQTWLAAVVQPHQDDARIALWELQNEAALDQQVVRDWLQVMLPYLKQQAGGTPVTVSVSNVEWLDDVATLTAPNAPDVYSLHWYPASVVAWTSTLPAVLDRARELIGPDSPLLLGEFGYETCTLSEASQAQLYYDVFDAAREKGVVHLGAWTFTDFPEGTAQCDPGTPASDAERYFGLFRLDGSPKPAADVVECAFVDGVPCPPRPSGLLNSSFEAVNVCGRLENWQPWDIGWSGAAQFAQDCSTARTGGCSVKVQATITDTVGLYTAPALPVKAGCCYDLRGYAQTQGLDGWARLVMAWFDADTNWLNQDAGSQLITGTNVTEWTLLGIEDAAPPAGAAYLQVYAQMKSGDPAAYVWFDDVELIPCRAYLPLVERGFEPPH